MTRKTIDEAKAAAQNFIRAIDEMDEQERPGGKAFMYPSPKHRASVRRKSMDLTRSLADLRRY